jgi:mono/diheme cytochrome c family protein
VRARRSLGARGALACTAALLLLLGASCGRPADPPGDDGQALPEGPLTVIERGSVATVPDDPQVRRGFEAWAVLCAPCHGQTGKGDGEVAPFLEVDPGDLTDTADLLFTTDHERMELIAEGLEGSPMIGWKDVLTDEEIAAVNAYMHYFQQSGNDGDPVR